MIMAQEFSPRERVRRERTGRSGDYAYRAQHVRAEGKSDKPGRAQRSLYRPRRCSNQMMPQDVKDKHGGSDIVLSGPGEKCGLAVGVSSGVPEGLAS